MSGTSSRSFDAESLLRSLMENVPGAIYRAANDEIWKVQRVSDEIESITGYPASDFVDASKRTIVDGHAPRRPRARRPGDQGGDRGAPAVRPRVPDPARRRERSAGCSSAGSRRSTATASSGSTGSSSTSPSAARPRSCASSASWRRSGSPSSRRRAPGSSPRATTPGGGSSATCTTARSSACSSRRSACAPPSGRWPRARTPLPMLASAREPSSTPAWPSCASSRAGSTRRCSRCAG